jgi:hypothetical protein
LRHREETAAACRGHRGRGTGIEKSKQEAPAAQDSESPEIASIVDSVLADMRPRIVAQISKKLNRKKYLALQQSAINGPSDRPSWAVSSDL